MTDNVRSLPGVVVRSDKPNELLIGALQNLLALAESGKLQSFIGTGFTADGLRAAVWCDFEQDVYKMLGSLAWVQAEYIHRHVGDL